MTTVWGLGRKLGQAMVEGLGCCSTMLQLSLLSLSALERHFDGKTASWLLLMATRGQDREKVVAR